MVPVFLFLFCLALGIAWSSIQLRRAELERMSRTVGDIREARRKGFHKPRVRAPLIDLTRCMGCTACVKACPEDGVLDLVHGQAAMVHGANCVGHGLCVKSCPSGAIRLDWGLLTEGGHLPALSPDFEVHGREGLYLIGEATGHGLIRNAVHQGRQVARRLEREFAQRPEVHTDFDLVVVGAGPGGLACAVDAAEHGLRVALLERARFGGTIYHYPREKLILTEELDIPGFGRLEAQSYSREELLGVWRDAFEGSGVELFEGKRCTGVTVEPDGTLVVHGPDAPLRSVRVCLAPGKRGRPRHLDVPGESMSKVHYQLDNTATVQHERILIVGGGESAVESALALSESGSNRVTLAYRGTEFHRVNASLREALEARGGDGLRILTETVVQRIEDDHVYLLRQGSERIQLRNDRVLVHAGSVGPTQFLHDCGVSFGGEERFAALDDSRQEIANDERKRLLLNLSIALLVGTAAVAWSGMNWDYYGLALEERPISPSHEDLRPSSPFGLVVGWLALGCLLFNLSYLLRRVPNLLAKWMTPRKWFALHVSTGLLMLPLVLIHGALRISDTTGGHGALVLILLALTGTVGRFVYAFLPRKANGHGLAHEDLREELAAVTAELEQQSDPLGQEIARTVDELCDEPRWRRGFIGRLWSLRGSRARLAAAQTQLETRAREAGRSEEDTSLLVDLLRRSYEGSERARHYDDLRTLLGAWRHLHIWLALLLSLLVVAHVLDEWNYGEWWPFRESSAPPGS